MVDAIGTALQGLQAATERVRVSANNIVNMNSVGAVDPADGPAAYTPQDVVQTSVPPGGVQAHGVDRDPAHVQAYNPDHPYAGVEGIVNVPNIDLGTEIVNMKIAEIAYRSSLSIIRTAEAMQDDLLSIVDKRV